MRIPGIQHLLPRSGFTALLGKRNDFVFLALMRGLGIILQLLVLKLSVHYLSVFELGIYFFFVTVAYSLNAILFVPLDYYQQSQVYPLLRGNYSLKSLVLLNKQVFVRLMFFLVPCVVLMTMINVAIGFNLLIIMFFSIMLYATTAMRGVINNLEHKRTAAALMFAEGVWKVAFLIIFFAFLPAKGITLLSAVTSALVLSFLVTWVAVDRLQLGSGGKIQQIPLKPALIFGWPISISTCFYWIQTQGYRILLVPLGFTEMMGTYATVSGIGASGMSAASSVYNGLFTPDLYKSSGKALSGFLNNAIMLIGTVLFLSLLFSNSVVSILTKGEFVEYSFLILFGVIAEGCTMLSGGMSVVLSLGGRMHYLSVVSLIGTVIMGAALFALYRSGTLTVWTLGVPLVLSQIASVIIFKLLLRSVNPQLPI